MPFPIFSLTLGAFACSLRRVLLPASGLALVALATPTFAQEEDREPLNRGEVSRALDIAEDHLDDAEKAVRDGDAAAAEKAWRDAGGLFLRVLEDYPDRHDVWLEMARVYRHLELWESVATAYADALNGLEDDDEILEAWTEMTNAYTIMENDLKVIEVGQKVLELNPNPSADIYVSLAASMARQEDYDDARGMAEKALELDPDSAVAHSTLGQAAFAGGDMEGAEVSFRRAVELAPETARAHAGLAEIHFSREEFKEAVETATKALDLNDDLTQAYRIRGIANNAIGNEVEAQSDLAMAITVNANDPEAILAFAQVNQSQGNRNQAENYYDRVTRLDNTPPSIRATAHLALGHFAIDEREYDQAVEHMNAALNATPDSENAKKGAGRAYFEKARALRNAQDYTGSLEAIEEARKHDALDSAISFEYGIVLYAHQRVAEAVPHLVEGVPNFPEDGEQSDLGVAHGFLGEHYVNSGDFATARTHLEAAIEILPGWGGPLVTLARWNLQQVQFGRCRLKDASFGERMTAAGITGCPASDADYERVRAAAENYKKAVALGSQHPALAEYLAVLEEVEDQIEQ